MALYVVLGLPLLVLSLPFVLPYLAWEERRQICPACGRRGTLEVVLWSQEQAPADASATVDWMTQETERVDPASARLRCTHCGAAFRRAELEGRSSRVPPA